MRIGPPLHYNESHVYDYMDVKFEIKTLYSNIAHLRTISTSILRWWYPLGKQEEVLAASHPSGAYHINTEEGGVLMCDNISTGSTRRLFIERDNERNGVSATYHLSAWGSKGVLWGCLALKWDAWHLLDDVEGLWRCIGVGFFVGVNNGVDYWVILHARIADGKCIVLGVWFCVELYSYVHVLGGACVGGGVEWWMTCRWVANDKFKA